MSRLLEGRAAIVTGSSRGLGFAIARAYVEAGASVLLCAREPDALERARTELGALGSPGQAVVAEAADVSSPDDAERVVWAAARSFSGLHVLVSNAGILGPQGPADRVGWEDWRRAIEINLLGSVLMCRAAVPLLRERGYGKIVQLSGGGATQPLPNRSAYAASKAAVVRFAETLAEEVRPHGIDVNALAPGALNTRMLDEILEAGADAAGPVAYERALALKAQGGASLEKAAALAVWLGSASSDGITGKLISAVWDPWETLGERRDELQGSDVYTLRRIVPADRGLAW